MYYKIKITMCDDGKVIFEGADLDMSLKENGMIVVSDYRSPREHTGPIFMAAYGVWKAASMRITDRP